MAVPPNPQVPQLPSWVTMRGLTPDARKSAMTSFLLQHAALHCGSSMSMRHFSEACGLAPSTLRVCGLRGSVNEAIADAVERKVGRNVLPKEWLLDPLAYVTK